MHIEYSHNGIVHMHKTDLPHTIYIHLCLWTMFVSKVIDIVYCNDEFDRLKVLEEMKVCIITLEHMYH